MDRRAEGADDVSDLVQPGRAGRALSRRAGEPVCAPAIPARLLTVPNAHQAAMPENALPGSSADRPKSPARMLATEGVVSALFYRVLRDRAIQENREPSAFYRSFGTTPDAVDGLDNAYLKVFAAIHAAGYDALAVVRAPETLFPTDALALESILEDV